MAIDVGSRLAHYEVISLLGVGGMGEVYLARDTRLEREVALKLLSEEFIRDEERRHRFEQEARVASALNHPNIITVYEIGQAGEQHFIAIELVKGETLRDRIRQGRLSLLDAIDIAKQTAAALTAAHEAGIIHRDIKPENIMIRPDGLVKVLDFGLAKQSEKARRVDPEATTGGNLRTDPGTVMGTPHYMSPEQARGVDVDWRTDIFSLGAVLYEMVTRRTPFQGETATDLMAEILKTDPDPISRYSSGAPDSLQQLIKKALAKKREDRFQSARDFQQALKLLKRDLKNSGSQETHPTLFKTLLETRAQDYSTRIIEGNRSFIQSIVTAIRRPSRGFWIGILSVIVLLAGAGGYSWFLSPKSVSLSKETILLADFENRTGDPVFDGTLKRALEVQLAQTPYLSLLPADRVRETLRQMNHPAEDHVTREIGREICLRRNLRAFIVGSITKLDRNYSISLEAINSSTGEAITSTLVEAEGRDRVLRALGGAARELREKLGESLVSIQKFNVPIEEATTGSLEALRDYSAGVDFRAKGQFPQAISMLKRAVELDEKFALACLQLGVTYRDMRKIALGNQYLEKAYQLRDRVSEREKIEITATYFRHITGEIDRRLESTTQLTQTYANDARGFHLHGNTNLIMGQHQKAIDAYREVLRLDPDYSLSQSNLAYSLIKLGRYDEAKAFLVQAMAKHPDTPGFHNRMFLLALAQGDRAAMEAQAKWFTGRPEDFLITEYQAWAAAFSGQLGEADRHFQQAAIKAESTDLHAEKLRILGNRAFVHAIFGDFAEARTGATQVAAALLEKGIDVREILPSAIEPLESHPPAQTLALAGDLIAAQRWADELNTKIPQDTINRSIWQPTIRAAVELQRKNPEAALQLLQSARLYEGIGFFEPIWFRGQTLLALKRGPEAAAEFQRIIDHRGWNVLSPLWPLAHLGLARAATISGDTAAAQQAYQEFFRLWKDADPNLPVLVEARREAEKR